MWHVVHIVMRIGKLLVDRWGNKLVLDGETRGGGLKHACRRHRLPDHRFDRCDGNMIGVSAKSMFERPGINNVIIRQRTSVRIDVINVFWAQIGALDRSAYGVGHDLT